MGDVLHFRLGICDFPPFTYIDHGRAYGPWVSLIRGALPRNATSEFVTLNTGECNSDAMLQSLALNRTDIAVHPMIMDGECDGCLWSYPLSSNGLVMVSGLESESANIFLSSFTTGAWLMVGAMAAMFAISAILMEWRRSRWTNAPHAFLTLAANIHMSSDVGIPAYTLYTAMVVCSTLTAALYTADLTSTVLQEKSLIGNNVKKVIAGGRPFSVVEGGPVTQMGHEFPAAAFAIVPVDRAEASLPSLMLWEQGERLVNKMCDPVVSVSGAINRLPYGMAFREGAGGVDVVNGGLREASLSDIPQASMVSWITGRYQCVEQRAVQMNRAMITPLLLATLVVYACVVGAKVLQSCWERLRARAAIVDVETI
jgi:hypothetical protein